MASQKELLLFISEKAPGWFIEQPHIPKIVNKALKEDEVLRDLMKKFKKVTFSEEKEKD